MVKIIFQQKNQFFLLAIISIIVGCKNISNTSSDRLIARAENHYLYLSDIKKAFGKFSSKEDSIIKAKNLINNWARNKLIYEKAIINLPENNISQINKLVNNYELNLYRNFYREFVLKSSMDSVINKRLVNDYYEDFKENFKLKEPLYRIRYIRFPFNNVDRPEIIKRFKNFDSEDIIFLDSLSFQFSRSFLSDSVWLNEIDLIEEVDFLDKTRNKKLFFDEKYYEYKQGLNLNLFQLVERLDQNQIAPLPYIEKTIRNIIFNSKKIDFLKSFDNDILQDAIKLKKFEYY